MAVYRIGIVGNIPKPYGGVATTCLHQTNQLLAAGYHITFYDRNRHPEKYCPKELRDYTVTAISKIPTAMRLISSIPRRCLRDQPFRTFLNHFFHDVFQLKFLIHGPITTLKTLLRSIEILRTFEGKNIEILHGHHALHDSWVTQLLAHYYFHCLFVVTVYSSEFTMEENHPWLPMVLEVCNRANTVICISQYARECMLQAGATPRKVMINYLGVESSQFDDPLPEKVSEIRQRYGLEENDTVVLYSGWLIARKGPHVLLDALSKIKHQPWKAIIVGRDMGLKNDLIAGVELLKLHERVIIMEGIPYEDLMVLYSQAQIFVFPTLSQDEGFGLVALEAMAHGVPVIGSRTGAIPEVVKDQETGFLFNPGDSDELAACLLKLLHQTDRRAEMGKAARIRASQFSWEKNASQLIQTYEEVIFHAKPI